MEEFENIRSSGINAIKLEEGDVLVSANITSGSDEILLTTRMGQSIRFDENDVRPMGRAAAGVTGMKLSKGKDDWVVGTVIIPSLEKHIELFVVSDRGYGKKTATSEYKTQNRAGTGILTYKVGEKTGHLIAARALEKERKCDILIATKGGMVLRLDIKQIPLLGRATQGVRLIRLDAGDFVSSAAILDKQEEE
jgi:DNA gyrase subunit A